MKTQLKIGLCALLGMSLLYDSPLLKLLIAADWNSAFVAVIMKIIKLQALTNRGDYTYNTVRMFVWVMYVTLSPV
jgi:hypothetical protein